VRQLASAKRVDLKLEDLGPFVILKVTNQGNPIPPHILESIFEPLVYHHHQNSSEPSKGLGLGLFIVREIAHAHGGTLEFPIVRIGFVARGESDTRFSGLVRHRISSEPDSGTTRRSFRGFRDLQEGRCLFCYYQHDRETSFN
jgi:hypothetical protein